MLQAVERSPPDVLLLDLMMPKRNGYEVCDAIRANPAFAKVHILMLTAKGQEVERAKGLALGADDYITKPFSTREVVERVRQVMAVPGPADGCGPSPPSAAKAVRRLFVALGAVVLIACLAAVTAEPAARSVSPRRRGCAADGGRGERLVAGAPSGSPAGQASTRPRGHRPRQPAPEREAFPRAWLGRLPESAAAVQARLAADETRLTDQLEAATARIDEQKGRLEAILLDLSEGVIVCGSIIRCCCTIRPRSI